CRPSAHLTPPHVEDVLVLNRHIVGHVPNMREFLKGRVHPWRGAPNQTFEDLVRPTYNGSGYVNDIMGIPTMSTVFWLPDRPLPPCPTLLNTTGPFPALGASNASSNGVTPDQSIPAIIRSPASAWAPSRVSTKTRERRTNPGGSSAISGR